MYRVVSRVKKAKTTKPQRSSDQELQIQELNLPMQILTR